MLVLVEAVFLVPFIVQQPCLRFPPAGFHVDGGVLRQHFEEFVPGLLEVKAPLLFFLLHTPRLPLGKELLFLPHGLECCPPWVLIA